MTTNARDPRGSTHPVAPDEKERLSRTIPLEPGTPTDDGEPSVADAFPEWSRFRVVETDRLFQLEAKRSDSIRRVRWGWAAVFAASVGISALVESKGVSLALVPLVGMAGFFIGMVEEEQILRSRTIHPRLRRSLAIERGGPEIYRDAGMLITVRIDGTSYPAEAVMEVIVTHARYQRRSEAAVAIVFREAVVEIEVDEPDQERRARVVAKVLARALRRASPIRDIDHKSTPQNAFESVAITSRLLLSLCVLGLLFHHDFDDLKHSYAALAYPIAESLMMKVSIEMRTLGFRRVARAFVERMQTEPVGPGSSRKRE